jgi:hypothetical protein
MTKDQNSEQSTKSITIKDVPDEYVEMFNNLVRSFPIFMKAEHVPSVRGRDVTKSELRTLFFCEMLHRTYDDNFSAGAGDEFIRRVTNRHGFPANEEDGKISAVDYPKPSK